MQIKPGQLILNRYYVDEFLATGGMGAVYKVTDRVNNQPLAMKVLHTDPNEDPVMFRRFQREAGHLQTLEHPHIVPFMGLYQTTDYAFMLERFIDGPSLEDVLKQQNGQPLSVMLTLSFAKALCTALGYAHANKVVHCDIKPGNVLIDRAGQVFLADFGIARHTDSTTTTLAGAGTVAYMSPEQVLLKTITHQTDIYSLAVLLFEMLVGARPFTGSEQWPGRTELTASEKIRYAHVNLPPPDPCVLNRSLSRDLGDVLLKALDKKASRRYSSTLAFYQALCSAARLRSEDIPDAVTVVPPGWRREDPPRREWTPREKTGTPAVPVKNLPLIIIGAIVAVGILISVMIGGMNAAKKAFENLPVNTLPVITPPKLQPTELSTETPVVIERPVKTEIPTLVLMTPTTINFVGDTNTSNKDGTTQIYVPAGSFLLGGSDNTQIKQDSDRYPQRLVFMSAFWIDQTEVTNDQYGRCVADGGCSVPAKFSSSAQGDYYGNPEFADYPVIWVSWYQAEAYCTWAGKSLPTEAQWEYAARGPESLIYPWGDERPNCNYANFSECGKSVRAVGSLTGDASVFGVRDMAGNVWEWVTNYYSPDYSNIPNGSTDPQGPQSGQTRVVRGGGAASVPSDLLANVRRQKDPANSDQYWGFRCVSN